jgi:hypothetical protein
VYIDETNLSESRSTVLRGILLTIFIPIGFVILSIITMIIIVLIRSARKEKLANIERLKHMSVNSKFMDDDGEVDAFFNNHQDFVV